jgi:hypothetical protein
MRKSVWVILAVLCVAIGAPNALADTLYTPTFTCTQAGGCTFLPTASDVSFPSPAIMLVSWDTFLFSFNFANTGAAPTDGFTWTATYDPSTLTATFDVTDPVAVLKNQVQQLQSQVNQLTGAGGRGALSFSAAATPIPEPSSLALMLAGIGFLLVMRKRIGQGPPQAA